MGQAYPKMENLSTPMTKLEVRQGRCRPLGPSEAGPLAPLVLPLVPAPLRGPAPFALTADLSLPLGASDSLLQALAPGHKRSFVLPTLDVKAPRKGCDRPTWCHVTPPLGPVVMARELGPLEIH